MSIEKRWYYSEDWMEGITIHAHALVDVNQYYRQYHARPDLWKSAFEFLWR